MNQDVATPGDDDEILTINEVAAKLKVNQQTVRNWIDRGQLEGFRVGTRRIRIRASALNEFLTNSSTLRPPKTDHEREVFAEALSVLDSADGPAEESAALREIAAAARRLASALQR